MAEIRKGSTVRQIMPAPIVGVVEKYEVDQETGQVQVLVVSPDADGDGNDEARYFKLSEVELVV